MKIPSEGLDETLAPFARMASSHFVIKPLIKHVLMAEQAVQVYDG